MNQPDWIAFCDDFSARFPSDFEWLDSRPKTLDLWFTDVFSGLSLADCLDVSQRIFRGTIPVWHAYERDKIPGTYRHHVGLMRQERRAQAQIEGYRKQPRKRGGGLVDVLADADKRVGDGKSMAECFLHCERMRTEHGATLEDRNAYVAEYFDVPISEHENYNQEFA